MFQEPTSPAAIIVLVMEPSSSTMKAAMSASPSNVKFCARWEYGIGELIGTSEERVKVEGELVGVFRVNIGINALRRRRIRMDAIMRVRGVGRAEKSEL